MMSLAPIVLNRFESQTSLPLKIDLKVESSPYQKTCQIEAGNDLEAVLKWLHEYSHQKNTYVAYKREAVRFLLWCMYEGGKSLSALKKEDLEAYFLFCQRPPEHWCVTKAKTDKDIEVWRPFKGPLSQSALLTAIRILSSLLNYLVQAEYLRANPIKLIKKYAKLSVKSQEQKYQVWARILETDEWQAVQEALMAMFDGSAQEKDNKMRTQFLFALLYFLGLRIHEVVHLVWGNFYQKNNQWWLLVKGKGDKLGHVPVNHQLLEHIKVYRQFLNKTPLPEAGESEPLILSERTDQALKITQLYSLVKAIGETASKSFPENLEKQRKLKALSPHWLRHLAASHQDRAGMPLTMIKENLRHQSSQTTQIYVHAEDDARFQQMQKMQMNMESRLIEKTKKIIGIEYRLRLNKGPVNKVMGLTRLLLGIEQQLFKGLEWVRLGEAPGVLLEKVKNQGLQSGIELSYQVRSEEVVEGVKVWMNALKRQCEIWLFEVDIKAMPLGEE